MVRMFPTSAELPHRIFIRKHFLWTLLLPRLQLQPLIRWHALVSILLALPTPLRSRSIHHTASWVSQLSCPYSISNLAETLLAPRTFWAICMCCDFVLTVFSASQLFSLSQFLLISYDLAQEQPSSRSFSWLYLTQTQFLSNINLWHQY